MKINRNKHALVLIIDDDTMQRYSMRMALEGSGFVVEESNNAFQGLDRVVQIKPDIIILDVQMPGMDGFTACTEIKKLPMSENIAILIVTGLEDVDSINKAYKVGATDFISKPVNWNLLGHKVSYILRSMQTARELSVSKKKLLTSELELIHSLGVASHFKDNETGNHIKRMSRYAEQIALSAGLSKRECQLIFQAAPMHDVGKIGIADKIILKPEKLTEQEFTIIKTHTTIGAELLAGNLSVLLQSAQSIAISHHEKWDGTGYPYSLSGEEIPLFGRICAIADVFDALASDRPYKKAWDLKRSVDEISNLSGTHFDPFLVDKFNQVLPNIIKIKQKYEDSFD